uniref:General transcription factor 3C polypeptide 6 n=1 Tax=Anthurium amnicola TaxID=1678845 RepID=A0A1D1XK30_9ARAE
MTGGGGSRRSILGLGGGCSRALARRAAGGGPHQVIHGRGAAAVKKVRLKWVRSRGLDHIIDRDTDVKAACLLKDAIRRSHTGCLPSRSLSALQKPLGLTVPVLRFLRRYPTLFRESPHPRYPSLPTFSLADAAHLLHRRELDAHLARAPDDAARLARLLMMSNSRSLPLRALLPLRWDLGLPDDFLTSLVPTFPDHFRVERRKQDGVPCLALAAWKDDLAVSELQRINERAIAEPSYRDFKRASAMPISSPSSFLAFPMSFPRGYGSQNKVKAWMEEFHKLPYISPYEDVSGLDPESDLMEKHVVGVLHELLSLTIHKKTKRNYLRTLRDELNLPHRFTRVFTRYPGIFYLSLKCRTTTVMLREGYRRGKLVEPHPLALVRDKFYHVMRTGILYRDKGLEEAKLAAGGNPLGVDGEEGDGLDEEMEADDGDEEEEEEEEFVFLDLDDVYEHADIPANTPYVLSGLNTLNPVLIIGDNLKLIGEYEETIGTCFVFSEDESETVLVHQETGPSEANLFKDKCIVDPNQVPFRQVKPVASLDKILKFRLAANDEIQMATTRHDTTS